MVQMLISERSEQEWLLDAVLAFPAEEIAPLLQTAGLATSGTKPAIRKRLKEALDEALISVDALALWLDALSPWGKQHVMLLDGQQDYLIHWQDIENRTAQIRAAGLGQILNVAVPLVLPKDLTISSITLDASGLNVKAVQRRVYNERLPDLDTTEAELDADEVIVYHAFRQHVTRSMIMFDWRFSGNRASLHMTVGQRESDYGKSAEKFQELLNPLLDLGRFAALDLRRAIARLHELEEAGTPEARIERLTYKSAQGRKLGSQSAMKGISVTGEAIIDDAMRKMRQTGAGHLANFVWLPSAGGGPTHSLLDDEFTTVLVGTDNRVNVRGYNSERAVRYVLSRIRALST